MNKARMIASLAVMGAATSGVALVPLPHYVSGPLHLQPRNAAAVYVDVPGQIQDVHAVSDQHVSSGQTILTLDNVDQWLAMARLEGQRAQEMAQLESLIQRDLQGDPSAGLEMDQVRESIAALQEQIDEKLQDVERLIVKSPVAGTIFPAPYRPGPSDEDDRLPVWSSTPLEARNVGAYLDDGTLLCFVGSPDQLEAVLAIDQTNIEFVSPGQPMKIQLDYLPSSLYSSKVARIAKMEMKATPTSLSSRTGGGLMTQTDATGKERPVSTTYQVSAPLDDSDGRLRSGLVGHGRIHVGTRTIGQHIWRYLCRTFRFDM